MRIGVACLYYEIEKTLEIIELNRDFINHLEIGIDTVAQIDKIAPFIDKIEELGLSIGVHLAMEINTCEEIECIRSSWAKFCSDMCRGVEFLKPEYLNLHMGYAMKNRFLKDKKRYLNNSVDFFFKLEENLQRLSRVPVITVENSYSLEGGDLMNTGISTGEFEYIFENTNKIREKVDMPYFCFDTGHCILSEDDYSTLKEYTKVVHISDCSGEVDDHVEIFSGRITGEELQAAIDMSPDYAVIEVKSEYLENSITRVKEFFKII